MDTSAISSPETKGAKSIPDQAIEKIFGNELEIMRSIRTIIEASSLAAERRANLKATRSIQIEMMIQGMRRPTEKLGKLIGKRRATAEVTMCENYFMILDTLLDENMGSSKAVLARMKNFWSVVRDGTNMHRDQFGSPAAQALFLLYRYCFIENIRFSKLHSQVQAHLALVEYRLRSGWLIGKYNGQWTRLQTDAEVIHKWVNEKGTNLTLEAYRFSIGQVHNEIKGSTPLTM